MSKDLSRRDLFTFWRKPPAPKAPPAPLRPPGALAEAELLETCQRCGRCVDVCPRHALGPVLSGPGAGTPFLVARQAPCVVCTGLQCTHVCPSGALTPLDDPALIRMGTAVISTDRCIAYRGEPCAACVSICPIPGALVTVERPGGKVPHVVVERCVGCGLCENFCPPEPTAIAIKPAR